MGTKTPRTTGITPLSVLGGKKIKKEITFKLVKIKFGLQKVIIIITIIVCQQTMIEQIQTTIYFLKKETKLFKKNNKD